jgi:hypothetical protein
MNKYFLPVISLTIVLVSASIFLRLKYVDKKEERKNWHSALGTYQLDIKRTKLSKYEKDTAIYKNLTWTLREDSTFIFSMDVPFIYDSTGRWNAGGSGIDEWNYIYYRKWGYSKYQKDLGDQFAHCCAADSTININSVTPQAGKVPVNKLVFKKLNPKVSDFE